MENTVVHIHNILTYYVAIGSSVYKNVYFLGFEF
jgi:hypothetical protein